MLKENKTLRIAYVTTDFNSISHTFIRREVESLKKTGAIIIQFGVRPDKVFFEQFGVTNYLYPIQIVKTLKAFIKFIFVNPSGMLTAFKVAIINEEKNPYNKLKIFYHFILSLKYADIIHQQNLGHIHAHFSNVPTTIAMFSSLISSVPYSFTCHSAGELNQKEVLCANSKLKYASFVRVIAEYLLDDSSLILKVKEKVHVIRCGLNFNDGYINSTKVKSENIKILAVGRLVEKKGFKDLLIALGQIKKQGVKFSLILVGSGPLLSDLKKISSEVDISSNVEFLDNRTNEEVIEQMKISDLLVVPSVTSINGEKEGIPTVIIEAMKVFLPVIATNHSGIPEVVKDNKTGFLVSEANPGELAEKIIYLLSNPDLILEVANTANVYVRELYDSSKITHNLVKLFGQYYAN